METDLLPVILNPAAAGGRAGRQLAFLENRMKKLGLRCRVFITQSEAHLKQLTRQLGSQNELVVGVGGDSTFHFMANELVQLSSPAALGIVGVGSSNDIPREFGLTNLEKALLALKKRKSRLIDLGAVWIGPELIGYVLGQVNIGLGVYVNEAVAGFASRWPVFQRWQTLNGLIAILQSYLKKKEMSLSLSIQTEEKKYQGKFQVAVLSNLRYWATGRQIAPRARPDDGRFDLFLLRPVPFLSLLRIALRSQAGKHAGDNRVILDQAPYFKLIASQKFRLQADGEILRRGGQPVETDIFELKVIPRCLRIITY